MWLSQSISGSHMILVSASAPLVLNQIFLGQTIKRTILNLSFSLIFLRDPSFMLKSYREVVVGGLQDFSVSPSPLWV